MITGHVEDNYTSSWTIVIELDKEKGKRDRVKRSIKKRDYKTKAEAERFMNRLIIEMEKWTYIDPSGMTISAFFEKWIPHAKKDWEYKTYMRNMGIINNYFRPELGHIKLENLTPLKIDEHYLWLQSDDGPALSGNTVRKHHNILHKALKQAQKWDLINTNPADNVDLPPLTKYEAPVLGSKNAIIEFIDIFKGTILYLATLIALTTSLRRGEICALRWQDVDWETMRFTVRNTLQRVKGEGLKLKPKPKNDKIREVALPPTLVDLLKHEYATRYEGTENDYHGDDYVCAWPDGRPIAPDYITHEYEKKNLPITFHGCRHSHDTLLFRLHVDTKLVANRAGRDEDLTRRTYEHVIPDMQDEVAMLIDRTLFGDENVEKK